MFESISSERNEGITMYRTKTKAVRHIAIATTLGLGLVGGIAGIAAADGGSSTSHDSTTTTAPINGISGTVVGYVAGTSISVLATGATVPTSYVLTAATTITGLATGATAPVVGASVNLVLSTTTPVTVTSITVATPLVAPPAAQIEGTVVAYVAGTSISVLSRDSTVPTVYTLDAATAITGLGTGVTAPAIGDNVDLTLSVTPAVVVMTIKDEGVTQSPVTTVTPSNPTSLRIEGTVSAFVAGTSISVLSRDSTVPTMYPMDAATTITGLDTGVMAPAIGDNVDLTLSTTTPAVVLTIKDEASRNGDNQGFGHGYTGQNGTDHGRGDDHGRGNSGRGNSGRGNSDHASWNNNGSNSSAGNFSNGSFSADGSDHGSSRH